MRGACRSEPEFLAVSSSVRARSYSARTAIPGDIPQFKCKVVVGQNQNTWRYFPVQMRGVFRAEPKFLAIFTSLNAGRFAARNEIPGGISQFKCVAFFALSQSVWRFFSVWARGVVRSEPEVLAVFASLDARRFSARTEFPGSSYQFKCGAFFG